jgi:hypothetical protein
MLPLNKNQRIIFYILTGVILLAIILTSVFILNIKEGIFPDKKPLASETITPRAQIDPAEIIKIDFLFNQNHDKLNLVRGEDGFWVLVDQPEKQLPQDEIENVLKLVAGLSPVPGDQGSSNSANLGLVPPVAGLTLSSKNGTTSLIEIGKVDQNSGLYNVRVDSGTPFLADFQTIYMILKTFYLKVLPVSLQDSAATPVLTPTK